MAFPAVSFQNHLTIPVVIYDSLNEDEQNQTLANYFGTLTQMGQVAPGATQSFQPLNGPASVFIVYDTNNNPIKRVFTLGDGPAAFEIDPADVDIITATNQFLALLKNQPNDPLATSFQALIKGGKATAQQVNSFFQSSADYQTCTFISYMLVITTLARAASAGSSLEKQAYSLSALCGCLGVSWPADLPDIAVTDFTCTDQNDVLRFACSIDLTKVSYADGVLSNIQTLLPITTVRASISFVYDPGLAIGTTILQFVPDAIRIPDGAGQSVQITKPTITLSISPLFKFVVFKVLATIPFSLFNSPTFHADLSMIINNVEAEVAVQLEEPNASLFTPPVLKGVHFDQVGVGMGVFFEPPGYAIGVQGKVHVGDEKNIVALDDDTFAVVCRLDGDLPNPLYLSFYVPKLDLNQIIEIFTNTPANIDLPVSASGLSFTWLEDPMQPIALPDGTLAGMELGFSAFVDLFGLAFYGNAAVGLASGVQGTLALAPYSLGPLKLTGNGQGVTIKVDANGNPIKNNQLAATSEIRQAMQNATPKQLIATGGPELTINSAASPYFTLGAGACLFDLVSEQIEAVIDSDGICFELDSRGLVDSQITCTLKDDNFSGKFSYGLDMSVPLPDINGYGLGTVPLKAMSNVELGVSVSASDLVLSVGGGFDFESLTCSFGPYTEDVDISTFTGLLGALRDSILNDASRVFSALTQDAEQWASYVRQALVTGITDVAQGLKTAFGQTAPEVAATMQSAGYEIVEIGEGIKDAFDASFEEVTEVLLSAGYSLTAVASAVKDIFYGQPPAGGQLAPRDFSGGCGENSQAVSDTGLQPYEQVRINGSTDLSTCVQANDQGCVYGITLVVADGLYPYVINVDAQGPSGFTSGSMYLRFWDKSPDYYDLTITSSTRKMHTVGYNSSDPVIVKIEWSDTSF